MWDTAPGKSSWPKGQKVQKLEIMTLAQWCFQREILVKKDNCKKIHSLNRVWTTEERSSYRQLLTIAETNRKNNSSPGKDFTKNPWTLFPTGFSSNALFLSVKAFSFPCHVRICTWLPMIEDRNCSSLLSQSKPTLVEERSGSLFISGQQYIFACVCMCVCVCTCA